MQPKDPIAQALRDTLISPNESDSNLEPANLVDAIGMMGRAISRELKYLGNGDADSRGMGAIEGHAVMVEKAGQAIADGLSNVADAIRELASAIRESK